MDFNIHISPKFRKSKKETTMEDKTINVNDEIDKAGSTVMGFIEQHPESLLVAAGAIFYVGYNIGRNKSMMDVMRIAAMSD